ncbi:hypothetical protein ACFQFH_01545 [Halobaculum halobium]|uniref:hypothetical protein n=1 Tax=Halobaculum halobium TaxID=3032281 RepID=UPI0036180D47
MPDQKEVAHGPLVHRGAVERRCHLREVGAEHEVLARIVAVGVLDRARPELVAGDDQLLAVGTGDSEGAVGACERLRGVLEQSPEERRFLLVAPSYPWDGTVPNACDAVCVVDPPTGRVPVREVRHAERELASRADDGLGVCRRVRLHERVNRRRFRECAADESVHADMGRRA